MSDTLIRPFLASRHLNLFLGITLCGEIYFFTSNADFSGYTVQSGRPGNVPSPPGRAPPLLTDRPPAPPAGCSAPQSTPIPLSSIGSPEEDVGRSSSRATVVPLLQPADGSRRPPSRPQLALSCLESARTAIDQGRDRDALRLYSYIASEFPDLALSQYARVGQALLTYEAGDASDAILELEDEAAAFVGSAEIHAALAALLYVERPGLAFRAEEVSPRHVSHF